MRHFDADAVHAALPWREAVEALRTAHATRSMPMMNTEIFNTPAGGKDQFANLTAWSSGRSIVVKMVGIFPDNPQKPLPEPSVQGLVALFDGQTGRPLMTCDGAALTYRKTAADSALGVDLLARPDANVLAIAGAGALAPYVIEAICTVRPIQRILIWNRTRSKAIALAERMERWGLECVVEDSFTTILPQADIVTTSTMATLPIVQGALLKPGVHVDLIGAYLPDMREADAETIRRAGQLFTDNRTGFAGSGDGSGPLREGLISSPVADLFDLCRGKHSGRSSVNEITVFKNAGGGHLDLFLSEYLYDRGFSNKTTSGQSSLPAVDR